MASEETTTMVEVTNHAQFRKLTTPAKVGQTILMYGTRKLIRTCNGLAWGWVNVETGEWVNASQIEYHLMQPNASVYVRVAK